LLVPLRDDRRGRRATIAGGSAPFRQQFSEVGTAKVAPIIEALPSSATAQPIERNTTAPNASSPATAQDPKAKSAVKTSVAASRAALLEPLSAMLMLAKPLLDFKDAWQRYIATARPATTLARIEDGLPADMPISHGIEVEPSDTPILERSFASELASLLGTHQAEPIPKEVDRETFFTEDTERLVCEPEHDTATYARPAAAARESDAAAVAAAESGLDGGTSSASSEVNGSQAQQEFVVPALRTPVERVVPLTRLPLRPQTAVITWPREYGSGTAAEASRSDRHAILERLVREPESAAPALIDLAYRQEDATGRAIALRILLRHFPQDGGAIFVDALRAGSDDERSLAIDGCAAIGAREELLFALNDRIDALAAKAALAYVGTLKRDDYRAHLARYVDAVRIETILRLLAGIVE